ncbi:hypothetical protein EVJ58_g1816 [Rhodofomes roseus]|uniref:DUF2235 domain-containing protein n=1 Tax=Rhodofomes roseus TaxID=34475 RepID=A0A4Y9YXQ9_9APHY|nr:hypothetical protein EVJ58_g1816 [Rhodofomes roseus]
MAETYTIPQSLRPGHASEHASVRRDSAPTMSSGKRLIVCCDGTWQDGIVVNAKWKYTNVLIDSYKLSDMQVGGGYQQHDLSDLTLTWMAANIGDMLDLNLEYLMTLPQPVKPWGQLPPHDPLTGVYSLAKTIQRKLPTVTDDVTHETVHLSVLEQPHILPELAENIQKNPRLICALLPLEEELRHRWHVAAENASAQAHAGVSLSEFVMAAHHEGSGHRVVSEAKKWVDFAVDNSTAAVMKHLLR